MLNILNLIETTKRKVPGYFESICKQRLAGGAGSCYDNIDSVVAMEFALRLASWTEAEHPDVMPGCKAYTTEDIPGGRFGLVSIADLPDDAEITAIDPKGTGRISLAVAGRKGKPVKTTWLIVGEEQGEEVIFTFHPGEPVRPSMVETAEIKDGTILSKAEAKKLGFDLAKVV